METALGRTILARPHGAVSADHTAPSHGVAGSFFGEKVSFFREKISKLLSEDQLNEPQFCQLRRGIWTHCEGHFYAPA